MEIVLGLGAIGAIFLSVVGIVMGVVWLTKKISPKWRRARKIMARGGPRSLDELRFLFPGACECGSKTIRVSNLPAFTEVISWGEQGGQSVEMSDWHEIVLSEYSCNKCGKFRNRGSSLINYVPKGNIAKILSLPSIKKHGYLYYPNGKESIEVRGMVSNYLTPAQAESVQDLVL